LGLLQFLIYDWVMVEALCQISWLGVHNLGESTKLQKVTLGVWIPIPNCFFPLIYRRPQITDNGLGLCSILIMVEILICYVFIIICLCCRNYVCCWHSTPLEDNLGECSLTFRHFDNCLGDCFLMFNLFNNYIG